MGNCSNLCSRIIVPNTDVPVNGTSSSHKNNSKIISKYNNDSSLKKILIIQKRIRGFLYRLKKLNKSSKTATRTKASSTAYSKRKSLKKVTTDNAVDQKRRRYNKTKTDFIKRNIININFFIFFQYIY